MYNRRTVQQLTPEEINELKEYLLFLDEEEFYEEIDEISDDDVYKRFAERTFAYSDFICNRTPSGFYDGMAA